MSDDSVLRTIPFAKPMIGETEKKAVLEVLNGDILVHGPRVKEFEISFAAFTGADYAISVSSCTAALHLTYFYLGLGQGDEVIVPAQTHIATAHAVELCGARPVFVDAEEQTGNINIGQIEAELSERTRAISVVHFLGMPVNMGGISQIAKKYNLFVVEDCALAIGSYFQGMHVGRHGDVGCFSFYPVKHITTAEGGMLITRHRDLAEKIARLRAFGVDRHPGERKLPGVYDVNMLGFNYRLNELQAALGIEQVKRLNEFLQRRRENYQVLSEQLKGIQEIKQFQSTHGDYQSSHYCLSILLKGSLAAKRAEMVSYLKQKGVGTSIYYPKPVPHMRHYKTKYGYSDNSFPAAAWISNSSIALPVGPHLQAEEMKYIASCLKQAINKARQT